MPEQTVRTIDLTDNDRYAEAVPYADFDRLRREDPVHWHPEPGGPGFWAVVRYDDVVAVSRDTATFSSETGATALEDLDPDALAARKSMLDMDPPRHTRLRRTLVGDFTRRQALRHEENIREVVRPLVRAALDRGRFDAVEHLATAVPIRVLCRMLGVPAADEPLMVELSDRLIANTDPDLSEVQPDSPESERYRLLPFRSPAALEMHAYANALRAERTVRPPDDVVTRLAQARIDELPLSEQEFQAMFLLLLVAGNETTRSALSLGIQAFLDHPGQWELLLAGADLDAAVEEVLRWTTPLHHFRRTATRDTELRGRRIRAGEKVVVWYTSANRDEEVFADPYRFDVTRDPNPHIAFGRGGPHRCLGEHLARVEIRVVLQELLAHGVTLYADGPARRVRSNFTNGLKSLPVRVHRHG
ncbi:cytochrome P450 [Streptomyces sp. GbtcB6]|uniref:cytochrome P450 n=1 Tax=Streptomyces sp. GbtcB6 TaxID=2824751 RepID=UPI001C3025E6|nr:cytochrome P450 [Streptomyces sp. GbtcB6]